MRGRGWEEVLGGFLTCAWVRVRVVGMSEWEECQCDMWCGCCVLYMSVLGVCCVLCCVRVMCVV